MEVIDDYLQKCVEIVETVRGQKKELKNYFGREDGTRIWFWAQQDNGRRNVAALWFFPGV